MCTIISLYKKVKTKLLLNKIELLIFFIEFSFYNKQNNLL